MCYEVEVLRRLAAGASSSISVALPFDLPVGSVVDGDSAGFAGVGFVFFLTITPFRFRLASFLTAGATMGLGGGVGLEMEVDAGG